MLIKITIPACINKNAYGGYDFFFGEVEVMQ